MADGPGPLSSDEWITALAARLGIEAPSAEEVTIVLEMAGVAAHASERISAPITCWLVGRSGVSPEEALELSRRLRSESS